MKKITILFALILATISWQSNAQYFTEDFEGGVIPPANWTLSQTNATETWKLDDFSAHGGSYAAQCQYDSNLAAQDEALITPVIDLTNATNPALSFWFYMSYYWAVDPYDNYDLKIQATTDGGVTFTDLWSEADFGTFENWEWNKQIISLAAYSGTNNLQLVFRYVGADGAQAVIDDISVYEGPSNAPGCASNLIPADTATLSISTTGEGTLAWDETVDADGYHVSIGTTAGTYTTTVDVNTNSYTASGLSDATTYYWLVVPFNTAGDATGCTEQSFTTQTAVAPSCAENLIPADGATDVTVSGTASIDLSWDAPSSGVTPTSYTLEIGITSGTYGTPIENITDTHITLSGASENTTYYWKITPMNLDVPAAGCTEQSFTTGAFPSLPNDECSGAILLTVQNAADYASTSPVSGSILGATDSGIAAPTCDGYTGTANDDVWYSFVATATESHITLEDEFDGVVELFSGDCANLTSITCKDSGDNPQIDATALTVGDTYYVRVYNYSSTATSTPSFNIAVWNPASSIADNQISGFNFYPNPVNNTLNLSAQDNIEKVIVYNISGQEVITVTPNSLQTQVDMSHLENGIYFVKAQINGQITAFKVAKK